MRKHVFDTALDAAKKIKRLPLDIDGFCREAGIGLLSVHDLASMSGLSELDVFGVIGNGDGAVFSFRGRRVIVFNDAAPPNRVRFTLCEELAHVLLGHADDAAFCAFSQGYSRALYAQYESESKLVAGMLLCPPQFYFSHSRLGLDAISEICGISRSCAEVVSSNYAVYKNEVCHNMRYFGLPSVSAYRALKYWKE